MNKIADTIVFVASFTFTSGVSYLFGIGTGAYVRREVRFTTGNDINKMDISIFATTAGATVFSHIFPRPLRTHIKFASGFFLTGYLMSRHN